MLKKINIKSELFFLKQYGFTTTILEQIYVLGVDPIDVIFSKNNTEYTELKQKFTEKEKILSDNYKKYNKFKVELFRNESFLRKDKNNKIYFKYDKHVISDLLPVHIRPIFMYAKGNSSLLEKNKRIAIIGTRSPSKEAVIIAKQLTAHFVQQKYTIVSGLAKGIDTISHKTSLDNNGSTIAVLPTNFNQIYPIENQQLAQEIEDKGLLLSSIGPKENTYKSSFLDRNRYVANISDYVVVVETNLKSGTMNTIKNASEAEKPIYFIDQKDREMNKKIYEYGGVMIDGK